MRLEVDYRPKETKHEDREKINSKINNITRYAPRVSMGNAYMAEFEICTSSYKTFDVHKLDLITSEIVSYGLIKCKFVNQIVKKD